MPVPLPHGLLLLPREGERTTSSLRRKVRLLVTRDLLGDGTRFGAALESALQISPDAILNAIGTPDVLPNLLAERSGLLGRADARRRALPNLLCALHAAGFLPPEPLIVEGPIDTLAGLPGGKLARLAPPARALLLDASGLEIELADGSHLGIDEVPSHKTTHVIPGTQVHLCVEDTNPLAHLEAHPEKAGNTVDLAGRPVKTWLTALEQAFQLVRLGLPSWFAELPTSLERLLPVGFEPERHLSASYGDAPGIAYLSLHPDPLTLAEAIVHETQHGKLNLLLWLDKVLENGRTDWATSPVRPDLRPLLGVLLAVHAFAPVASLHARLAALEHPLTRTPRFKRRRAEVLAGNEGGLEVLRKRSRPTRTGARLLEDLEALHAATLALAPESPSRNPNALPPG